MRRHDGNTDTVLFYAAEMEIARENILKHQAQKNEPLVSTSKEKNPANSTSSDSHTVSSVTSRC